MVMWLLLLVQAGGEAPVAMDVQAYPDLPPSSSSSPPQQLQQVGT